VLGTPTTADEAMGDSVALLALAKAIFSRLPDGLKSEAVFMADAMCEKILSGLNEDETETTLQ
jgi:hypothetical protein